MTIILTALKQPVNTIDASFECFDQNKDGVLTEKEYVDVSMNMINLLLKNSNFSDEIQEKFFSVTLQSMDDMCSLLNGKETIFSYELPKELDQYLSEKEEELKTIIKKQFEVYDMNQGKFSLNLTILDGKIDFHEWVTISKMINEKMNNMFDENLFSTTFKAYDLNNDGSISLSEYETFLLSQLKNAIVGFKQLKGKDVEKQDVDEIIEAFSKSLGEVLNLKK